MDQKQKQKPHISKTFQKEGKWIEKPTITAVLVCICGNKYLKTREPQTRCLTCMRIR